MDIALQVLRAKIRGFQSAGISIANQIKKSSGLKRQTLWQRKRLLGAYSREHLIAYGLLRGIPYERIESCAKENRPNPNRILELMKAHTLCFDPKLTLEHVKELLSLKPCLNQEASCSLHPERHGESTCLNTPKNNGLVAMVTLAQKLLKKGV